MKLSEKESGNIIDLEKAVSALLLGELVAFPTETVYGLGADATNIIAIEKLYALKKRPSNHPLIVHIASINQLPELAVDIPECVYKLADVFWPGPLTILLRRHPQLSTAITGGQGTVAIRIPSHPIALALLTELGRPLVAPSANKFGRISPTTAAHVFSEFGNDIAGILDGGPCTVGIESTILDLSCLQELKKEPKILRPGAISAAELEPYLDATLLQADQILSERIQVSGSYPSHYAPQKSTCLVNPETLYSTTFQTDSSVGVLAFSESSETFTEPKGCLWVTCSNDPAQYAHNLYRLLRELDASDSVNQILIEAPPDTIEWKAVLDRITKASAGKWFEI